MNREILGHDTLFKLLISLIPGVTVLKSYEEEHTAVIQLSADILSKHNLDNFIGNFNYIQHYMIGDLITLSLDKHGQTSGCYRLSMNSRLCNDRYFRAYLFMVQILAVLFKVDFKPFLVKTNYAVSPKETFGDKAYTTAYITSDKQLAYEARKGSDSNMYDPSGNLCKSGISFCQDISSEHDCLTVVIEDVALNWFTNILIRDLTAAKYKILISNCYNTPCAPAD